ncbi:MAG: MobF family relaxase, partial [Candidatus Aenigmatarchaeota archaeon]
MVSLSIVKDSKYFTQVNHQSGHGMEYYAQHGIAESWWQGSLAEKEGLSGAVTEQDVARMTQGYERVGLNVTYSAPKSVSLAYSLLGDQRVKEAHEQAVRVANEWLEKHLAETRQGQGGEEKVPASGVAIANFTHYTSRENDPQLHTHSVILNAVERSTDGKLTALEPQKIFEYQKALDQVYKNELARALQEMGYSIHMTDQHGNFEITGFPQQVLDAFSTRREQVLETAERLKNES